MNRFSTHTKAMALLCAFLAGLLFIGVMDLAYGYYTFLRLTVFVGGIVLFFMEMTEEDSALNVTCGACALIALLFNPIFPVYLDKETWVVIDLICGIVFLGLGAYHLFRDYQKK